MKKKVKFPQVNDDLERQLFDSGYRYIVGVDEVGRGSWAGPVVVAAYVYKMTSKCLPHVRDSKLVTRKRRESLFPILTQGIYSIGLAEADEVDHVNVLAATKLAIERAVRKLTLEKAIFLVDGLFSPPFHFNHQCIINGDEKHYSIAAASILAKVYRDRLMREYALIYPDFGFERHVGYGTPEHQQALLAHGVCSIHRRSYKPIKRIIKRFE